MKKFAFAYYSEPKFKSQEEGVTYMKKWETWAGGLGKALAYSGVPLKKAKTVSSDGVSDDARSNRLTGFSIVEADNMEAAIEMAKRCPHLEHGTVDVAEAMEMEMKH